MLWWMWRKNRTEETRKARRILWHHKRTTFLNCLCLCSEKISNQQAETDGAHICVIHWGRWLFRITALSPAAFKPWRHHLAIQTPISNSRIFLKREKTTLFLPALWCQCDCERLWEHHSCSDRGGGARAAATAAAVAKKVRRRQTHYRGRAPVTWSQSDVPH